MKKSIPLTASAANSGVNPFFRFLKNWVKTGLVCTNLCPGIRDHYGEELQIVYANIRV